MPVHKLILLPTDPNATITGCDELAACLQSTGLTGEAIPWNQGVFYPTGNQFLQLISFLGCSPTIELEPPTDPQALDSACANGSFCHIVLTCSDKLQFHADPQTRPPRCPHCNQPVVDWRSLIDRWTENPAYAEWTCPACGHPAGLTALVFRKSAGFGKVFVEIRGIYPSEAVPGDSLLNTLQDLTGCPWQYMYIKE